ncbi:proteasome assembly chaperone 2 isoform X2 [Latimeria chalumnae]
MPRVGYIHTECLLPMVGNNPYATTAENTVHLSTSADVYSLPDRKLTVLQIRSPVVQNKGCQLRQVICAWVKKSGFAKVVVLSSSHAYLRSDQQLHSMPLRYLVTPAMQTIVGNKFQKLKWKELEKINEAEQHIRIPGGGITKSLYNDSCSEGIPMAVLLIFCSEGDNIPDAFSLVNYLNEWLRLVGKTSTRSPKSSSQWKKPSSWKLMFGSGIPPAIF